MKKKVIEIVCLVLFIALASYAIISLKDFFNKDEDSNLTEASDIANTIESSLDKNVENTNNQLEPSQENVVEQITVPEGVCCFRYSICWN